MTETLSVQRMTTAHIPTEDGSFAITLYQNNHDNKEHLAIVSGEVAGKDDVLVRVHSECFTGDVLGSRRCDCGEQLALARRIIAAEGAGIIIYMRQEGRGIGLLDKLRAYNLQDAGYDTVEANVLLGHEPDERDYTVAARILEDLRVKSIRLLTNNPSKIEALTKLGVTVKARMALEPTIHPDNVAYLMTKASRMDHMLSLEHLREMLPPSHNGQGNGNGHGGHD